MDGMTKDLWILTASMAFAMACTFFAAAYHPESYSVAQPETTVTATADVAALRR